MIGLDTNVLLRLLLGDDADQAARAEAFVLDACSPQSPCLINRIVLVEMVWVLQSGYRYRRDQVATIIENILRTEVFTVEDAAQAWAAVAAYRQSGADFADCLIAEVNRAHGCDVTVTFDKAASALEAFVAI